MFGPLRPSAASYAYRVGVPVALSNCLWMYCAFLSLARPWHHTVSIGLALGHAAWLIALVLAGIVTLLAIAASDRTGRPQKGSTGSSADSVRWRPS